MRRMRRLETASFSPIPIGESGAQKNLERHYAALEFLRKFALSSCDEPHPNVTAGFSQKAPHHWKPAACPNPRPFLGYAQVPGARKTHAKFCCTAHLRQSCS